MTTQLRSINDAYQAAVEFMAQDKAAESVVIEFMSHCVGPMQATITRDGSSTFTELTQRKLSKALLALEKGEAGPRIDILGRKFIDFHPKPKPVLKRAMGIEMTPSGIKIKVGITNKYDFSKPRLDDALKKRG
jgi:hypothetical protein